jgi:hypothetical protein
VTYTERGAREVGMGYHEALAALRRRRATLQAQMGLIEAELADLGKIEAALSMAAEAIATARQTIEAQK